MPFGPKTEFNTVDMNASSPDYDPYPLEDFAPTLSQCFSIVIIGYLLARLELLSASDVKGVIGFASYFAIPGIICVTLADADFDDFRWELVFGLFLGKCLIFTSVAVFLVLLNGNLGVAGTVALFCTQSNDLPVGMPLMSSLYGMHRPQMIKYLVLITPVSIIFFLPVSNIMVRIHRLRSCHGTVGQQRQESLSLKECLRRCLNDKDHVNEMHAVVKNPIVIATVVGLISNAVFRGNIPEVIHQPVKVAAAAIPGLALAILGFSFVRKERYLLSSAVVQAAVLLILRIVLTPILLHTILKMMTDGSESSKLLSDFALLYGIISPATAAFLTGPEFRKPLAVMSVALILTSFSCFPLSYIVARLTIAPAHKLSSHVPLLKCILFWTACIAIFCDVGVWILTLWRNRWCQVPRCYTMYLVFTQILTCSGVVVWSLDLHEMWATYCQMILCFGGEVSGYLWTGTLAVLLVFREKYSLMEEHRFSILCFTAFSVSALITSVMCIMIPFGDVQSVYVVARPRSNFEFLQLIITTILLSTSLLLVAVCLVHHFKKKNFDSANQVVSGYANTVFYIQQLEEANSKDLSKQASFISFQEVDGRDKLEESDESKIYYDEMAKDCEMSSQDEPSVEMRDWTFQMSSLLTLQGLTMLVRLIGNLFKLADSIRLEVMIPMEFLQSTLFIGQGVFIFLTLGVDVRTAVISLRKWRKKEKRETKDKTPIGYEVSEGEFGKTPIGYKVSKKEFGKSPIGYEVSKGEFTEFCRTFCNFYYDKCFQDIGKERRWKNKVYKNSFWGHQLVDWLVTEGICSDDIDAESKGQKLMARGVIERITNTIDFYDAPHLYYFVGKV